MQAYEETESPSKGMNYWLAAPQLASRDMSISEAIVPELISRLC